MCRINLIPMIENGLLTGAHCEIAIGSLINLLVQNGFSVITQSYLKTALKEAHEQGYSEGYNEGYKAVRAEVSDE